MFDSLLPATEDDMIGRWIGSGIETGHPLDGVLEAASWYGKIFESAEAVHPLVHKIPLWGELKVNPALLPLRIVTALPGRHWIVPMLVPVLVPFVSTRTPKARMRTIDFRGRPHAAMIYDAKPIIDVFAKLDANTVMGWMDYRGMDQPFFFTLTRQ